MSVGREISSDASLDVGREVNGNEVARSLVDLAAGIRSEAEQADQDVRSALGHYIEAGCLLMQAKEQLVHGQWLPWLSENFAFTPRHAQNYMKLASNAKHISHLGSIDAALKQLAPPVDERPANDLQAAIRADLHALWDETGGGGPEPRLIGLHAFWSWEDRPTTTCLHEKVQIGYARFATWPPEGNLPEETRLHFECWSAEENLRSAGWGDKTSVEETLDALRGGWYARRAGYERN